MRRAMGKEPPGTNGVRRAARIKLEVKRKNKGFLRPGLSGRLLKKSPGFKNNLFTAWV